MVEYSAEDEKADELSAKYTQEASDNLNFTTDYEKQHYQPINWALIGLIAVVAVALIIAVVAWNMTAP